MKKLLATVIALVLLVSCALGDVATEESPKMTYGELVNYTDSLRGDALQTGGITYSVNEDGYTVAHTAVGDMVLAEEMLTETSAILSVTLDVYCGCPRGIWAGDSVYALLDAYYNYNPNLEGSESDAALYIQGEEPEIDTAWVVRDGQRIMKVGYEAFKWTDSGVLHAGVYYTVDQNIVIGITIEGLETYITAEEAAEMIAETAAIQEETGYHAYRKAESDDGVTPFEREDLYFAGMDMLDLTVEKTTEILGSPEADNWVKDSTGDYLRSREWEGVTMLFAYDSAKKIKGLDTLYVYKDVFEGPRGVRTGDMMETVLERFAQEDVEAAAADDTLILYGDGENAPMGVISYSVETTSVTYRQEVDGKIFTWLLTFRDGVLEQYILQIR